MSWDVAMRARPLPGELRCGDVAAAMPMPDGSVLVCVCDGLGHGEPAAIAAEAFCSFVATVTDAPLDEILARADRAIAGTRGVVASLLRLGPGGGEYAGIGNVTFVAHARVAPSTHNLPGIIGRRAKRARVSQFSIDAGDLFIMHTDGVPALFDVERFARESSADAAALLALQRALPTDDALCAVVRAG